ncbi:MAG TPA: hypothetical protein VNM92_10760 [Thermoanaerobaculia bacterium]|nr:hypothetical protein [Thermoanaerobaculia bacterium]
MKSSPVILFLSLLITGSARASDWSFGAATGPFVFGHFAERSATIGSGETRRRVHYALSAETQPGVRLDFQRDFNSRISMRFEGSFVDAPLAIKTGSESDRPSSGAGSVQVAGMRVTAVALPLILRINRRGTFRPFLGAGPGLVVYQTERREQSTLLPLFTGTRRQAGLELLAGLEWSISRSFSLEGDLRDSITRSPFRASDLQTTPSLSIRLPSVHNLHSTFGIRYRF